MTFNFRPCDRDQSFLLPPDMREWLPADHMAWALIDVVGLLDLGAFDAAYRRDGSGAAAYDPQMMLTLLLYALWRGEQSSRRIEQACRHDIAYRVICGNQVPDHTTISRFRQRFEREVEGLLVESIRLAHRAGLVDLDIVAIDGRKLACDASLDANRSAEWIEQQVREWLEQNARVDAQEDLLGDEPRERLPVELADPNSRHGRLARAKAQLDAERDASDGYPDKVQRREAYKAEHGKYPRGRPPLPPKDTPDRKANTTDPESRVMKGRKGFVQGYNGQTAVSQDQIVLAANVVQDANDVHQLTPTLAAARHNLIAASITTPIKAVVVDGGYGTEEELQTLQSNPDCPDLYVAITSGNKNTKPGQTPTANPDSARGRMHTKLRTATGKAIYNKRSPTVEGVFGHQETLRFDRYSRRGQAAAQAEWALSFVLNNLLKVIRHGTLAMPPQAA